MAGRLQSCYNNLSAVSRLNRFSKKTKTPVWKMFVFLTIMFICSIVAAQLRYLLCLFTLGDIFRKYTQSCLTLSCLIFACTSHSEKCSMLVSWRSISVSHTRILSRAVSNSSLWLMKCCRIKMRQLKCIKIC